MSVIYFIRNDHSDLIKIGTSESFETRLQYLRCQYSKNLTILGVMDGNQDLEKILHTVFAPYNSFHEWFHPHENLLSYIQNPTKPYTKPHSVSKAVKLPYAYKTLPSHWKNPTKIYRFACFIRQHYGEDDYEKVLSTTVRGTQGKTARVLLQNNGFVI